VDAPLTTTNIQAGWRSPRVYTGQALETSEECTASAAEQQVIDEESDRLLLRLVDVMWSYHCLKHTLGDEQLDTLRDSLMQSSSLWHASHQMCHPDGRALGKLLLRPESTESRWQLSRWQLSRCRSCYGCAWLVGTIVPTRPRGGRRGGARPLLRRWRR
jgi:hypothetical protein